jgi:hypothetical protein
MARIYTPPTEYLEMRMTDDVLNHGRRKFFLSAAAAVFASLTATHAMAQSVSNKLKIGVIGSGQPRNKQHRTRQRVRPGLGAHHSAKATEVLPKMIVRNIRTS